MHNLLVLPWSAVGFSVCTDEHCLGFVGEEGAEQSQRKPRRLKFEAQDL